MTRLKNREFPLMTIFVVLVIFFVAILVNGEKKVSVSEVVFDSPIEFLEWAGTDHNVVFARTQKGHVYRSTNRGKNWRDITDVFARLASVSSYSASSNYLKSSTFLIKTITVNPVDKNIVLMVGSKHLHFISTNAGETFRRISHSGTIHTWIFHPTKAKYALFSSWTEGCNKSFASSLKKSYNSGKCVHQLFVTKDLGATYLRITDYVVQFHWDGSKNVNVNRVFFTHHRKKQGDQPRHGGWMKSIDFSYTDDYGSHIQTPVEGGNKFLASNGYIFVAKIQDFESQTVSLMVSTNDAYTFNQVKLPHPLTEKSYTILDTSEKTVMLHVNHGDDSVKGTGHIYISNIQGTRFALSLMNNVRTPNGECEFDRIMSLEGVYIANVKDNDFDPFSGAFDDLNSFEDFSDLDTDEEDADISEVDHKQKSTKPGKVDIPVRTVITYNKGGEWSYLRAPSHDSRGNVIDCSFDSGCYLHLHGVSNYQSLAPFYSVENAIGIILGTGNVGSHLSFEHDEINTYMSRDGGHTWMEVHKGAFIYELGDFGGLIVMANDLKQTNQVIFSWNEGLSWYDFELGNKPLQVDNILIEPNSSSMEFLLYGSRGKSGVLYHLDFNTLGQVQCVGPTTPDRPDSDYETWSPFDGKNSENCILGKQLIYTRKKQTAECYNGQDFRRPIEKKTCACTEEDFTCEFGFSRQIGSFQCRPESVDIVLGDALLGKCTSSGVFYVTAYRKLPGDSCIGGWVPPPVAIPCPSHAPSSSHAKIVLIVAILVILFMLKQGIFGDWRRLEEASFDAYKNVQYRVLGAAKRRSSSLQGIISTITAYLNGDNSRIILNSKPNAHSKKDDYSVLNNFNNNIFMDEEDEDENINVIAGNGKNNPISNYYNMSSTLTATGNYYSDNFKNEKDNKANRMSSGSNLTQRQRSLNSNIDNAATDPIFDEVDIFEEDIDSYSLFNVNNPTIPKNDTFPETSVTFDPFETNIFSVGNSNNSNIQFPKIQPPPSSNDLNISSSNDNDSNGIELL
ncbi:hypothetical protein RS030_192776 [Cryptosporidium xiaoi]|uniref:VPS10 domain-containing protein n=1 Tax=Cryptosporidium xiaoi TaxID=659607 RepID=A0AAV9XZL7_9CRYT